MKDLAKFLGPYTDLHTFYPGSIVSAVLVGETCVDVVLFNGWDMSAVAGGLLPSLQEA